VSPCLQFSCYSDTARIRLIAAEFARKSPSMRPHSTGRVLRGSREPWLFHKPASQTPAVASARVDFLNTALAIPDSRALLMKLFDKETLYLARKNMRMNRMNPFAEPGPVLEHRIEEWAVGCHLADRPVRDWWIFAVAKDLLGRRLHGPYPTGVLDGDDDDEY